MKSVVFCVLAMVLCTGQMCTAPAATGDTSLDGTWLLNIQSEQIAPAGAQLRVTIASEQPTTLGTPDGQGGFVTLTLDGQSHALPEGAGAGTYIATGAIARTGTDVVLTFNIEVTYTDAQGGGTTTAERYEGTLANANTIRGSFTYTQTDVTSGGTTTTDANGSFTMSRQ